MDRLTAIYHLAAEAFEIEARAQALAVEQSVEMPLAAIAAPHVHAEIVGRVDSIEPDPQGGFVVRLALSVATTGFEIGQLLNMLFGNSSIQETVRLLDVELPAALRDAFPGPRFGIEGLRQLTGARHRPLTATALKPQGLDAASLAALAGAFAQAGIDVIKDDHGLADQAYAPFADRVAACQKAIDRANRETGGRTVYAPSLSGGPKALAEQIRIAKDQGVRMAMLTPMLKGLALTQELVRDHLDVPVLGHPAMAGASRIAPPLLLGKLFRLAGIDAVIYPNHGGRFSYAPATCQALAQAARVPWGGLRPSLPVPAGGMSVERVAEMVQFYGPDTMLLIGGNLLEAGPAMPDKARAFVAAVAQAGAKEGRG